MRFLHGLAATYAALALLGPRAARADDPVVPGFTVNTYATVTNPNGLDFDAEGNLYTGRNDPANPTGDDLLKIQKIAPGGSPVTDHGTNLPDADGVLVDLDGSITGTVGSVVSAGRGHLILRGQIAAVSPGGAVTTLHPSTTNVLINPNYLARGRDGLLVTDASKVKVFEFVAPGPPTVLINSPAAPLFILVDATNRIFVSHNDGSVRIWDADGVLVDDAFATGLGALGAAIAFGKGGAFGTDLYALDRNSGELSRIAPDRTKTVVGTGFPTVVNGTGDIEFGPDGALYVSLILENKVLRIAPLPPPPPPPLPEPVNAFLVPKKVTRAINAETAAKSKLTASGLLDLGSAEPPHQGQPSTLEVGAVAFPIPSFTSLKGGKVLQHSEAGLLFKITLPKPGSSKGSFVLVRTADISGEVPADGDLRIRFLQGALDPEGVVTLVGGKFKLGKVRGKLSVPGVYPAGLTAVRKGAGQDTLTLVAGFGLGAAGAPDPINDGGVTVTLGALFTVTVPGATFTKKGEVYTSKGGVGGITSVVVDLAKERITVKGKRMDLAGLPQPGTAPGPVRVGITIGALDELAVVVRLGQKGAKLTY